MLDFMVNDGEFPDLQKWSYTLPEHTSKADTNLPVQIKLVEIKFKTLKIMHFYYHLDFAICSKVLFL